MCEGTHVHAVAGTDELITKRLRLRPWTGADADAALGIFGRPEVARWLTPAMPRVADRDEMRQLLARWITEHDEAGRPLGHWAIEIRDSGPVIGAVALLPLPPGCALTSKSVGKSRLRPGGAVTGPRPATRWRIRLSPTAYRRCSPLCAWATPAESRPHNASEWSGSARPTSTTASRCKSTDSPQPIWTIPNPPRARTGTDSPTSCASLERTLTH